MNVCCQATGDVVFVVHVAVEDGQTARLGRLQVEMSRSSPHLSRHSVLRTRHLPLTGQFGFCASSVISARSLYYTRCKMKYCVQLHILNR